MAPKFEKLPMCVMQQGGILHEHLPRDETKDKENDQDLCIFLFATGIPVEKSLKDNGILIISL